MTDATLIRALKTSKKNQTAKFFVASSVLRQIPYFTKVFSDDDDVLKSISKLADKNNIPYIRYKAFQSEDIIVKQREIEKTVYWLLKGEARIRSGVRILGRIKPITCFGELAVVESEGRTATVEVPKGKKAEVIEIDWDIIELHEQLKERFHELLLKSYSEKLKNSYLASARLMLGASDIFSALRKRIHELTAKNAKLKAKNSTLKQKLKDKAS